jgi:hypothetical protein
LFGKALFPDLSAGPVLEEGRKEGREKRSIDRVRISSGFAACYTMEGCWVEHVELQLILIDEFAELFFIEIHSC